MPDFGVDAEQLRTQNKYFQKRLDELTGQTIKADAIISRATRELRQRRQALALLSELHGSITTDLPTQEVYRRVLMALQASLKLDGSVVLEAVSGRLSPAAWIGTQPREGWSLPAGDFEGQPVLAHQKAAVTALIAGVRENLGIPFFVAVPIVVGDTLAGLLVSGRQRELKPFFPPLDEQDVHALASLAGFLGSALSNARLYQRQRQLTESFRRFVPQQFLEMLGRGSVIEVGLGDQVQRTMSILFSDIRSFTTISETMTPKANFDFINRYLEFVAPAVLENGGFIDKYIGDAIMALFPEADSAVRAAIGLHRGLARFNRTWAARGNRPLAIGAGVHTGSLMLGTIGFRERMDTTVISDAVNLASRMEGLTKQYGAGILITGDTAAAMARRPPWQRTVDRVLVKGKSTPVEIVEVFAADPPPARTAKKASRPAFTRAMKAYCMGNFAQAEGGFAAIVQAHPEDGAAALLLKRSQQFLRQPPKSWQGVVAMEK